jgi:hypothetical protein
VLANPGDLPARSYTVAWTEGPQTQEQDQETDA